MEDEQILNVYLKAVADLSHGGRVTAAGRQFIEEIEGIFKVAGTSELVFQGVVTTIATERFGEGFNAEQRGEIESSLRSFLKSGGSPFKSVKVGRISMIQRK